MASDLDERESGAGAREGLFALIHAASHALEPERGRASVPLASEGSRGRAAAPIAPVSTEEIAAAIDRLELPRLEAGAAALREALASAVRAARYWQWPDGTDALAATPIVRDALARISRHVAGSPAAEYLTAEFSSRSQVSTAFDGAEHPAPLGATSRVLADWHRDTVRSEGEASLAYPADPADCPGGEWWSTPPFGVPMSTPREPDGSSAALWFTEDEFGWERAQLQPLGSPAELRVFEIDGPEAWAELCRRFPLDVSALVRRDWFETTGRPGDWVVPDWHAASNHFDAIHLTVLGYLSAAGSAIPVDAGRASVIAGWTPGGTSWLTDRFRYLGEPETWAREDTAGIGAWRRVGS
ncbi:hypothetical protein JD292_03455 [Leucobacter sp. CSA2]|uniref:Uncharacterized protein n=1 Tax=Leucobacter edaphi TaxID=2796472 RepID=A0A934QDA0_9MICO|nr:hypothetical protein [Leucobacter edaphi]MBK0421137.1 hypothetical protein [Leucobacter edaphi]